MSRNTRVIVLAVVVLALAWASGPAGADVSGLGAGDSLGDPAGPMQMGVEYSGAFKSDNDLDHVLFSVANPGSTLQFVVTNTYGGCDPDNYCPIWGTLLDTAGRQLGGEGSGAGTGPVGPSTSDSIVWTFPAAGNYILVLEGNGDLATYRFRADVTSAGGGSGGGGGDGGSGGSGGSPSPPQTTRLHSAGRQRGTAVRALLTLRPAASRVTASLVADGRRFGRSRAVRVGYLRQRGLGPGAVSLRVPLFARVRRAMARLKSLRVTLVVTVTRRGSRPIVLRLAVLLKPLRR
jgi:hypothetical protein